MEPEIFESYHKVRTFECDYYGHVNNATYLNYLEFARMETLEAKDLTLEKLKRLGFMVLIHRIDIQYLSPSSANDVLVIRTYMKSHRNSSGTFNQQILKQSDERVVVEADVTWVITDLNGRPLRIPQILRDAFNIDQVEYKR